MRFVALAVGLLGLVACSTPAQDGGGRAASATSSQRALGAMRTRDYKVTWLPGQKLRVEDARGAVVADGVTIDDLARIDPFLEAACTNAKASASLDSDLARPMR
jgi:hypothetical protein